MKNNTEAPPASVGASHKTSLDPLARFYGRPSYPRLVKYGATLTWVVPVLITLFLLVVGVGAGLQLAVFHDEKIEDARKNLDFLGKGLAGSLEKGLRDYKTTSKIDFQAQRLLMDVLPPEKTRGTVAVVLADKIGKIVAQSPSKFTNAASLFDVFLEAEPLMSFGEKAGVLHVRLAQGQDALVAVHHLPAPLGSVAVIHTLDDVLKPWRQQTTLTIGVFAAIGLVLLVLALAFYCQTARSREAERVFHLTRQRVEMALMRGKSGLFDWDMTRGKFFLSASLFDSLGLPAFDRVVSVSEVNGLLHPDDASFLTQAMAVGMHGWQIDRTLRMRHTDLGWVWLRVRGEMVQTATGHMHLIGVAHDMSEHMQLQALSDAADLRLRDAIEAVSSSFALWDAQNCLVLCNSQYQALHSLPDTLVKPGTPLDEVMKASAQNVRQIVSFETDAAASHKSYEVELEGHRWLQISERRTKDGGTVSVGTEITQIKNHEAHLIQNEKELKSTVADLEASRIILQDQTQQLEELATKYAEANRVKSEFLANMSHELRTPLNAIIGFSEIMESGLFGELGSQKYLEYCKDIRVSGSYLLSVINDILEMSKLESGDILLEKKKYNVCDTLYSVCNSFQDKALEKNISMHIDIKNELFILADDRALTQVFSHLLSNAIKFSSPLDTIAVCASLIDNHVQISFEDKGCGIAPDILAKIGQPFVQVGNQLTKSYQGSGLGLAIAKSIVAMHDGDMRITSQPQSGTLITLVFPVAITHHGDAFSVSHAA